MVNIACLAWGRSPEKAFIVQIPDPATTYIATLKEAVHTNLRLDVSFLPHDLLLFVVDESVSVDDKRLLEAHMNVKSQPGKLRISTTMADGEVQAAESTVSSLFRARRIQNPLSPISRYFASEPALFEDDDLKIQLLVYIPGTISVLYRSLSPLEAPWPRINGVGTVTQNFMAQIVQSPPDTKANIPTQFTFQPAQPALFQFQDLPHHLLAEAPQHTCRWSDCQAVFSEPTQLRDHIVKDHIGKKSEGNLCLSCSWEGCGIQFKKRDHIVSHIKRHVESWPFSCMTCGRSYKHAQDLRKHERTHRKADDTVISAAGGAFKNAQSEKRPQRTTPRPSNTIPSLLSLASSMSLDDFSSKKNMDSDSYAGASSSSGPLGNPIGRYSAISETATAMDFELSMLPGDEIDVSLWLDDETGLGTNIRSGQMGILTRQNVMKCPTLDDLRSDPMQEGRLAGLHSAKGDYVDLETLSGAQHGSFSHFTLEENLLPYIDPSLLAALIDQKAFYLGEGSSAPQDYSALDDKGRIGSELNALWKSLGAGEIAPEEQAGNRSEEQMDISLPSSPVNPAPPALLSSDNMDRSDSPIPAEVVQSSNDNSRSNEATNTTTTRSLVHAPPPYQESTPIACPSTFTAYESESAPPPYQDPHSPPPAPTTNLPPYALENVNPDFEPPPYQEPLGAGAAGARARLLRFAAHRQQQLQASIGCTTQQIQSSSSSQNSSNAVATEQAQVLLAEPVVRQPNEAFVRSNATIAPITAPQIPQHAAPTQMNMFPLPLKTPQSFEGTSGGIKKGISMFGKSNLSAQSLEKQISHMNTPIAMFSVQDLQKDIPLDILLFTHCFQIALSPRDAKGFGTSAKARGKARRSSLVIAGNRNGLPALANVVSGMLGSQTGSEELRFDVSSLGMMGLKDLSNFRSVAEVQLHNLAFFDDSGPILRILGPPFTCNSCNQSFATLYALKLHRLTASAWNVGTGASLTGGCSCSTPTQPARTLSSKGSMVFGEKKKLKKKAEGGSESGPSLLPTYYAAGVFSSSAASASSSSSSLANNVQKEDEDLAPRYLYHMGDVNAKRIFMEIVWAAGGRTVESVLAEVDKLVFSGEAMT